MKFRNFKAVMKPVARFLLPYKVPLALVMLAGTASSILGLLIPGQVQSIADAIRDGLEGSFDYDSINRNIIISAVIVVLLFIFSLIFNRRIEHYAQSVCRDIRSAINKKLDRTDLLSFNAVSAGDLIARMTEDVDKIGTAISKAVGPLLQNVVLFVAAVVLMLVKCPPLAAVVVGLVALGAAASSLIARKAIPLQQAQRANLAKMNAVVDESLSGHLIIKSYHAESRMIESFETINHAYAQKLRKGQIILKLLSPIMLIVNNTAYVLICIIGAYMMFNGIGSVTIGVLVAFILYAKMLAIPVSFFAGIMSQLTLSYVSASKITEFLSLPEMADDGKESPEKPRGEVIFENVRFGYEKDVEIIHGFNAKVSPGMKVAVVGPTGAGKTTLVNLLMRFFELNGGSIKIDGVSISEMPRKELHTILGMVLQDTFLFSRSIRDNIVCYAENVTDEQINDAVKKCGLDFLISTLPNGLDTVLTENTSVSAGQKQLITIARAMIRDPAILILDEATSSVDTRTELLIQKALDELMNGKTSFVIAHRLSTIKNADMIFVMSDGDIVETGTHEELLGKGGLYAELYYSQFDDGDSENKT